MNLATHAGLIAGTSVLTIASTGTTGDLDSVIDGIINDSATISGDDACPCPVSSLTALPTLTRMTSYAGGIGLPTSPLKVPVAGTGPSTTSLTVKPVTTVPTVTATIFVTTPSTRDGQRILHGFGNVKSVFLKANSIAEANTLQINNTVTGAALEGQGEQIGICYEADQFRSWAVQAYDGTGDDDFADFRVDFLAMGSWDNCDCFNAAAGSEATLVIGAEHLRRSLFDGTLRRDLQGRRLRSPRCVDRHRRKRDATLLLGKPPLQEP